MCACGLGGGDHSTSCEEDVHDAVLAVHQNHVALKGNMEAEHSLPPCPKSCNNKFRITLSLYTNVTHFECLPGVETRCKFVDIFIVQENTEGEYSDLEYESMKGVIEGLKIITEAKSLRIAKYAFQLAQEKGHKKVTAVHKANIMKLGDGLYLQSVERWHPAILRSPLKPRLWITPPYSWHPSPSSLMSW